MTKFILISGKKQSGKDYTAKVIKKYLEEMGKTVRITSFATPIKNFVHDVFGIPLEDMETEEGKQKPTHLRWKYLNLDLQDKFEKPHSDEYITVRQLLQMIGTDVLRLHFYNNIWAEAPFRKEYITAKQIGWDFFEQYPMYNDAPTDFVIIPDCRFPNEVAAGLSNDAALIRITTPSWGDVEADSHSSEVALDDYLWRDDEKLDNKTVGPERIIRYIQETLLSKLGL